MKRLLLTGANGFIGRHCLPFLLERGYEVHAVVPEDGMQLGFPGVQWHIRNLLDLAAIDPLMQATKPTHLLHFAWVTQPGVYGTSPDNLHWLQAGLELLQTFRKQGGERAVMAGTCAEYDWRFGYCSERLTPLNPATLYGACKKALYEVLERYRRQEGFSAAWGRIFFLYGPYEHPARLVPSVVRALLDGLRAPCSHGNQVRDFLYVEDVASAFAALLDSPVEGAVNLGSGKPVTVKDVVCHIARQLSASPDLVQFGAIPAPEADPPLLVADIERLRNEVGWSPAYDLQTGLAQAIDWWRKHKSAA